MEQTRFVPAWCKAAIVILLALVLVLGCVTFQKVSQANALEENAYTICGGAMAAIEADLRAGEPVSTSDLEAFYTITQLYPGSAYAYLSELLLVLEDPDFSLTEEERLTIADGLQAYYLEETSTEELTDCYQKIQAILEYR